MTVVAGFLAALSLALGACGLGDVTTGAALEDNPYAVPEPEDGVRAAFSKSDTDPPLDQWVALQLQGSWRDVGGYGLAAGMARLDSDGTVRLRGSVTGGACPGVIAYLPPKMRPSQGVRAYVVANNGRPLGVHVDPFSGEVRAAAACAGGRVSLDGIAFATGAQQATWTALSGWVWQNANAYGLARAGYYQGNDGVIRLTGTIKTLTCPRVSFPMPQGAWPTGGVQGLAVSSSAGATWVHAVPYNGAVRFEAECGTWLSLDGVRFFRGGQWSDLPLTNGWRYTSGYGLATPSYFKDGQGRVFLRGTVTGGSGAVAVLPQGHRPSGGVRVFQIAGGGATLEVIVNPFNGEVVPAAGVKNISLDGISFRTD